MIDMPTQTITDRVPGQLLWFFLFLAAFTGLSFWGLSASNNYFLYMSAYMWSPALAALCASAVTGAEIRCLGLSRWGSFRTLALSFITPFAYGLFAYLLIWSLGWASFNTPQLESVVKKMGLEGWPLPLATALYVVMFGLSGTLGNMPSSFGEELGWRGFLAPRLRSRLPFVVTAVLVGVIWGAWHYPLILKNADPTSPVPVWVTLVNFTLFTVAASVVFNSLSEQEESVWPAVVLHSAHNCFILGLFEQMTKGGPQSAWYTDETGVVLWATIFLVALTYWAVTRRKPAMK
jgi:uncharacterized protein